MKESQVKVNKLTKKYETSTNHKLTQESRRRKNNRKSKDRTKEKKKKRKRGIKGIAWINKIKKIASKNTIEREES